MSDDGAEIHVLYPPVRVERNARARVRKLDPKAKLPAKPYGEGMPL